MSLVANTPIAASLALAPATSAVSLTAVSLNNRLSPGQWALFVYPANASLRLRLSPGTAVKTLTVTNSAVRQVSFFTPQARNLSVSVSSARLIGTVKTQTVAQITVFPQSPSLRFSIHPATKAIGLSSATPRLARGVSASQAALVLSPVSSLFKTTFRPSLGTVNSSLVAASLRFTLAPTPAVKTLAAFTPVACVKNLVSGPAAALLVAGRTSVFRTTISPSPQALLLVSSPPVHLVTPLFPAARTLAFSSATSSVRIARNFAALSQTLTLTPALSAVLTIRSARATAQALVLTGTISSVRLAVVFAPTPQAILLSGNVSALRGITRLFPQNRALIFNVGFSGSAGRAFFIPTTAAVAVGSASGKIQSAVHPTSASLTLSGVPDLTLRNTACRPATGTVQLLPATSVLAKGVRALPASLTTSGATEAIQSIVRLPVQVRALALAGATPAVLVRFLYRPTTATVRLVSVTPGLAFSLRPYSASLGLTGRVSRINQNVPLRPVAGTVQFSGATSTLAIRPTIYAAPAVLVFTPRTAVIYTIQRYRATTASAALSGKTSPFRLSFYPASRTLTVTGGFGGLGPRSQRLVAPGSIALLLSGAPGSVRNTSPLHLAKSQTAIRAVRLITSNPSKTRRASPHPSGLRVAKTVLGPSRRISIPARFIYISGGTVIYPLTKTPQGILDYTVMWDTYLAQEGATILSSAWTVADGYSPTGDLLSLASATSTATTATVVISGGSDGSYYWLTNTITFFGGRAEGATIRLTIAW